MPVTSSSCEPPTSLSLCLARTGEGDGAATSSQDEAVKRRRRFRWGERGGSRQVARWVLGFGWLPNGPAKRVAPEEGGSPGEVARPRALSSTASRADHGPFVA